MTDREAGQRVTAAIAGLQLRAVAAEGPATESGHSVLSTADESTALQPTLLLPAADAPASAMTAVTELLGSTPAPSTHPAAPAAPANATRHRPVLRRGPLAAIVIGGLILGAGGIALGVSLGTPRTEPAAPATTREEPDYPEVGGTTGDHLEQLQRSVAP